jgi:hypothetical protein
MNESIDLLFAQMGDIGRAQEEMKVTQELGTKALEQVLRDQSLLAKQLELTGQAVAKLTLEHIRQEDEEEMSIHSMPYRPKRAIHPQYKPPPANRGGYYSYQTKSPHHTSGEDGQGDINMCCPNSLSPSSMAETLRSGDTSARISFTYIMCLIIFVSLQQLCI